MTACSCSIGLRCAAIRKRLGNCRSTIALLWLLVLACGVAAAQGAAPTTTISGTVFDPRLAAGMPNPLPLPNVLVYASTTPVTPPASGAQCVTYANSIPTGANIVSYTYTAVDGTFTLQNIPEGATYTIVIQAGKWERQFDEAVGTGPLTGLQLGMPANHTQGNMPYIAIATGSVDGAECVLRDMGISDSEFTDDNQTVNAGGFVHLYRGTESPGAEINASTPVESALMSGTSTTPLNNYDMVMFPCQGSAANQANPTGVVAGLQPANLLNFAEAGGRIFATHYSYAWLDPVSPYGAQFGNVANWTISPEPQISSAVGTVQENFSDGIFLADWLHDIGSTNPGTTNQIDINILRLDVSGVIAPAQSWVTLNNGTYANTGGGGNPYTVTDNPVMQMTFNVPFGAPAASQCGRVMYNDYHVINISVTPSNNTYPKECPSYSATAPNNFDPSYTMKPQEQMLEYALFDLSGFVQPTVVPTVSVTFTPSPLLVKSGDTADQLTVNVNSGTNETDSSAVLSFVMPSGLTITGMSDPTGGWVCTVSTASCSRTSGLAPSTTDSVTLTISVAAYTTLSSYSGTITATVSSAIFSTNPSFTEPVIFQQLPPITWPTPANIVYGTPLSGAQLDASSTVAGTFTYSPAAGTVLGTGPQTLTVTFAPTDTTDYTTAKSSVTLTVVPGTPTITLTSSPSGPIFANNAVSFIASLPSYASTETGTMTFYSGSTAIGTATVVGGSATLTTTALAAGIQSITAVYSGDADYGPGTSSPLSETVQDFTLTFAGAGSVTAQPGGQATFSLVATPMYGTTFPAGVTLSASNLPLGMTATFSPATISAGSASTTVALTITLPGKATNERPRNPFGGALPVALCLMLLPFARRMRKARSRLARLVVLLVIGAALAVGFTGCGSTTSSQKYSFSVTAASGALSHSLTPGLTVE